MTAKKLFLGLNHYLKIYFQLQTPFRSNKKLMMSLIIAKKTNKKKLTNILKFQSVSIILEIENPSLSINKHFL